MARETTKQSQGNCIMPDQTKQKGFTLVEIIAVLAVASIVAAVAISRMASTDDVNNKARAEALKSHIRYVQMRAMNTDPQVTNCNSSYGIHMNTSSYFMFRNCSKSDKVILPGSETDEVSLGKLQLSVNDKDITYDKYGRPCSDLQGNTLYTDNQTITLGTETIKITKNTGFVP